MIHRANNMRGKFMVLWLVSLVTILPGCGHLWAQNDDRRLANLEQAAVTAQNRGDYAAAATFWSDLLKEFPQWTRRGEALHNHGLCLAKLGEYERAADQLRQAIAALDPEATESLARAHLYLGFSQLEWGKQLATRDEGAARIQFQEAANTLAELLRRYPNYAANHEALYFQGMAYENLGAADKALTAFQKLAEQPQATFYLDGLFSLGYAHEQLGQIAEARQAYAQYLRECGDHYAKPEVQLRAGEVAWQLAKDAESRGDFQQQQEYLIEATDHLANAAAKTDFAMRDAAMFRLAWLAFHAGSWKKAGDLFVAVTNIQGSVLRSPAMLLAGRAFLQAEDWDVARSWLSQSLAANDELSPEAAHWLAQLALRRKQPAEALSLATDWVSRTSAKSPMYIELLMDRAEAAAAIPEQQAASVSYYLDVARADPSHRLAPIALYQAAFTLLEQGDQAQAIALCRQFEADYPQHDYLPDVQEVWADAALAANQFDEARRLYDQLAALEGHAKQKLWSTRRGVAAFFQKRFDEAATLLESQVQKGLADPSLSAETHYWLGCARMELKQLAQAAESFENALAAERSWPRRADAFLLLIQSLLASHEISRADQVAHRLFEEFPRASQSAEAALRVALQSSPEAGIQWLQKLVTEFPDSPLMPQALLALGRRLAETGDDPGAQTVLRQLIERFPQDQRAIPARIEWASLLRRAGKASESREELASWIESLPADHPHRLDAQWELALTESAVGDYAAAVQRWERLLGDPVAHDRRDRLHYELAWTARQWADDLRGGDAQGDANEHQRLAALAHHHFSTITQNHTHSPYVADAWFQVAQHNYAEGHFEAARDAYQQALAAAKPGDRLRERAYYKLGWAYFKLKAFADAQRSFEAQLAEFPEGILRADGMFMLSESLFAQKNYQQALAAFRAAKPVIEESAQIAPENRWFAALHAAQSANQLRDYPAALEFAQALANDASAADSLRLDAWLEIGNAHLGMKNVSQAVDAWRRASADLGKTGVRAACMIGDALFAEKKYDEAIQQFKLVLYGYGGLERNPEIDPWKAFAAYETARCYHVQIEQAEPAMKRQLLDKTIEFFQYLVDHYPDSELAGEAKTQLERLRRGR